MRISEAARLLREAGISTYREEARRLFSHIEGAPEYTLIASDPESTSEAFAEAMERRCKREPLQYIIGEVGFYKETYKVTPDCLIPREDTEILVDYAVKNLPRGARVLDLCTGSGCIAVSTVKNLPESTALALDISEGALSVARENAEKNGVSHRVDFILRDVLSDAAPSGSFDAILSNPPYVKDSVYPELEAELHREPRIAFVGGEDGGDFYRHITKAYSGSLKEGGFIAFEIGYDQRPLIEDIARAENMTCEVRLDLSGHPRVAILRHKS